MATREIGPNLRQALIAFAFALGVAGFMFAIGGIDDARFSSPEYWHYKHHWSPGTNNNCTGDCQFIENSKKKKTTKRNG